MSIDRAARSGTIIGWFITKQFGISILNGTIIRPNEDQRRPPYAEPIKMRLVWWSHGVFGCTDGTWQGDTHRFKQGEAAPDPLPYFDEISTISIEALSERVKP